DGPSGLGPAFSPSAAQPWHEAQPARSPQTTLPRSSWAGSAAAPSCFGASIDRVGAPEASVSPAAMPRRAAARFVCSSILYMSSFSSSGCGSVQAVAGGARRPSRRSSLEGEEEQHRAALHVLHQHRILALALHGEEAGIDNAAARRDGDILLAVNGV